ncbi:MAG: BolA family transcriptional regulator [Hyphomicrobiales bacterium]|nr:BolA family transcriptional regulator [Hyphomicrobiales bacterium]PCJ92259.1 MAG: BolA family transcriptional regulator [Hyphomicrobiales bacterium]
MPVKDQIEHKLTATFQPSALKVIDESHLHKGHGGWREGGETHFRVEITAPQFADMTRLARHRAINECLAEELSGGVHALALRINA